jgi:hypothetical protein
MKSYAVVFTYSFDADSAVYLFDTEEKAIDYMMKSFEEELRIDQEENGWDSEGYVTEDKMYAKIITHYPSGDGVTEYHVANVYEA